MIPVMGETEDMAWVKVEAGQDHLAEYSTAPAVDALVEFIWNALDAEANLVEVVMDTSSVDAQARQTYRVDGIVVRDNGHGISQDIAAKAFRLEGDSWKKSLNGRTLHGLRVLHGHRGRGRFYGYALGWHIRWNSVSEADHSEFLGLQIDGEFSRIQGFTISDPAPSQGPTGTTVTIEVEQDRSLASLVRDDIYDRLTARLAPHLLGNSDIAVHVNTVRLDPNELIDGSPIDISLNDVPPEALKGFEFPVLTIIDWKDTVKAPSSLILCSQDGVSLVDLPDTSLPAGPLKSTGYLKWSGFSPSATDLLMSRMQHSMVIDVAEHLLTSHIRDRMDEASAEIVERLKEEGAYPYQGDAADPVEQTERQMYELLLLTSRRVLTSGSTQSRAMTAKLLQVALQERPQNLDEILAKTLRLGENERDQLADMLRVSTLGYIVGAAAEVTRRLDLVIALRHLLYDAESSKAMREIDQLHPLVRDNVWLFGETWRLASSEVGLTQMLRSATQGMDVALEQDLVKQAGAGMVLPPEKRGRVDLLLQRTFDGPTDRHRLVVELKRPSVALGSKELDQVKRYARALAGHPATGGRNNKWTFWLVGTHTGSDIEDDLKQVGRDPGNVFQVDQYTIWVMQWGQLLDNVERTLNFYRDQLQYNITQDEAVERVRARHEALIPPAAAG
jgi:hypothetical protein